MSSLVSLLEESLNDSDLVTIEATVSTGFEYNALEECIEKIGESAKAVTGRGRIYFNIPVSNISNLDTLRSVDHLFIIIRHETVPQLSECCMQEALNILKSLVVYEEVCKAISIWKVKNEFGGVIYPSTEQYVLARHVENEMKSLSKQLAETRLADENESKVKMSDKEKRTKLNALQFDAYHEIDSRSPQEKVLKFRVTCVRNGAHGFSSENAAQHVGGTLQDIFHWVVDLNMYDIEFILNIRDENMYYGVALTKESRHHRNITAFGPTTLRATICYNMLRLAKPKAGDIIVDPMCGGGSIPIEGIAAYPLSFYMCGDIHEKAVSRIQMNAENLSQGFQTNHIDIFTWDTTCLPLRNSCVDIFITDLPFGKRMGSVYDNRTLYKNILIELARVVRCSSGQAVLLTSDKRSMHKALAYTSDLWTVRFKLLVNIGGLHANVFLLGRSATDIDKAVPFSSPPKTKQTRWYRKKQKDKN